MITENYVNFEIAKLLKEKGFDEGCSFIVNTISKGVMPVSWPTTNSDIEEEKACLIALPTLQMAMKWLREVHKIEIRVIYDNDKFCWYGTCNPMIESQILLGFGCKSKSYEEACEAAIKYCLENLI